jgi:release factor glutamine methyltransferase
VVIEFLSATGALESPRAIDVGTGSGNLAVASAYRHRGARFVAIDSSEPALAVAKRNAIEHGVADRIDFRLGDLLAPVAGDGPFDAVLSNPPYIPTAAIRELEPGVRDYEPWAALDGGPGGLDLVRRLVEEAVPLLKPGGHLILEIGTNQERPVRDLIAGQPELRLAPTVHDHAQHPRVVRATRTE